MYQPYLKLSGIVFCLFFTPLVFAKSIHIAVASNFLLPMKQLAAEFEQVSGHKIILSSASTGKLFAQLMHGAPYDLFFSADGTRADLLVKKGLAKKSSVYARGQIVFVAKGREAESTSWQCRSVLNSLAASKLAIANPKTAPYGLAARETLIKLGKWDAYKSKLVMGENILQAYQFITTGNVNAGFIAASLVVNSTLLDDYCQWLVPARLHQPIYQKMVILNRAKKNMAVIEFFNYMKSAEAKNIIIKNGYLAQ